MTYSLNEIEAMGRRAARGAGFHWGLAEESGKAARWLVAHGFAGVEELAEVLTRNDGKGYDELMPIEEDGVWRARSGSLCPLVAGPVLCDRAKEVAAGREIVLGPTAQPLMLAPYAAGAAQLTGATVALSWEGVLLLLAPQGISIEGTENAVATRSVTGVRCRCSEQPLAAPSAGQRGRDVDAESWSRLSAFAHRTLAPATEASRLAGAGAGLVDND